MHNKRIVYIFSKTMLRLKKNFGLTTCQQLR